ncbi:hypothetical protein PFAG_00525 [Plasmodium falciparum Santa Lucia]|uniref:Uncharacterized protein n=1 Tax=Plasmodium falciparum Santa Lucia TaxID=478859 RepID=W7FWF2_PLAFA|nr:hypothetical protein PFAG_00525 [Plasmodium falciparum Santa Lucia]
MGYKKIILWKKKTIVSSHLNRINKKRTPHKFSIKRLQILIIYKFNNFYIFIFHIYKTWFKILKDPHHYNRNKS